MVDLNISVRVLSKNAPFLMVWWNEKHDCADGFLVTCTCQGYQLGGSVTSDVCSEWYGELTKALQAAEIATMHPTRLGRSLCREVDIMTVDEIEQLKRERQKKARGRVKRKRKKNKKELNNKKDKTEGTGETAAHMGDVGHVADVDDHIHQEDHVREGNQSSDGIGEPPVQLQGNEAVSSGMEVDRLSEAADGDKTESDSENCQDGADIRGDASVAEEMREEEADVSNVVSHDDGSISGVDGEVESLREMELKGVQCLPQEGALNKAEAGIQRLPGDMVTVETMAGDGEMTSTQAIPETISAVMKELFASSVYQGNNIPVSNISIPITLPASREALHVSQSNIPCPITLSANNDSLPVSQSNTMTLPGSNVPVLLTQSNISLPVTLPANNPLVLIPENDIPIQLSSNTVPSNNIPIPVSENDTSGATSMVEEIVPDPVQVPGFPKAIYIKDLSDPEKVAEWQHLQRVRNEKFLAKCNKKRRRFIHFVLCEICGAALCSKTYQAHLENQHQSAGQREPKFSCQICGKKFMYVAHVSRHELIHQKVRFQCQFCPKSFSQSGACRLHEKTHNEGYDGELARLERKFKGSSNLRLNPWVKCVECGKQVRKSSMKKHLEVHDPAIPPPEPLNCLVCGKNYSGKGSLATHMKVHGEKQYACEVCGKKFHQRMNLKTHMRIHTKERPIPCRYCSERFSRHQARINHERRHTGEKPYYCHVCDKSWRDRVTFTQHMKRHHPNEPVMTLRKKKGQIQVAPQMVAVENCQG